MDEDYGASFITVEDDDGNEIELEIVDSMEMDGKEYVLFLPADMNEDDPDYGYVLLRIVEVDGEEQFEDVEDQDELQSAYEEFMRRLFEEEEEEDD